MRQLVLVCASLTLSFVYSPSCAFAPFYRTINVVTDKNQTEELLNVEVIIKYSTHPKNQFFMSASVTEGLLLHLHVVTACHMSNNNLCCSILRVI